MLRQVALPPTTTEVIKTVSEPTSAVDAGPARVTARFASWVAGTRLDAVPPGVGERAKHLILDGVGCGPLGAGLPRSQAATDAVCQLEGAGPAVVLGRDQLDDAGELSSLLAAPAARRLDHTTGGD